MSLPSLELASSSKGSPQILAAHSNLLLVPTFERPKAGWIDRCIEGNAHSVVGGHRHAYSVIEKIVEGFDEDFYLATFTRTRHIVLEIRISRSAAFHLPQSPMIFRH